MYFIEFFLTRNCNQSCYYCGIFKENKTVEVDIDRVKYILDNSPSNLGIEMTGGEIGLIKNLDDVFKAIYNHKHTKHILALSNGLIRVRGVDWLDKVEYIEHLIKDIKGTDVEKFYDIEFLETATNIIVATEMTTKSLLFNWDHFKHTEFVTDKFFIKPMNKTRNILRYAPQAIELFKLLGNKREIKMTQCAKDTNLYANQKQLCCLNTPSPFVDFDENVIGHCAITFHDCKTVPFTVKNYKKLPYGELFNDCEYCKTCHAFDDGEGKINFILESKRGNFQNRNYAYTTK